MIGFAQPLLLIWALAALMVAVLAGVRWTRRRRRAAAALGEPALVARVAPALGVPSRRPLLWALAAVLVGVAAAGPILGTDRTSGRTTLPDVVLVVDASNSMRVEDLTPSRLEVERRLARQLLPRLAGTRVGVVVFAGQGYVVSPLTRDMGALDAYLEAMTPEMIPQGGSSLSSALRQGAGLLASTPRDGPPGTLLLMTDGDALEEAGEVMSVAELLGRARVPVHTVGIATRQGGLVPDIDLETGRRIGYKQTPDGNPARSALGDSLLRALARRTGGRTWSPAPDLADRLVKALPVPTARPVAWNEQRPGNRYAWLVAATLLVLALDSLAGARAGRRRAALLALATMLTGCAPTPQADYRAGRYAAATEGFARRIQGGDTSATTAYNLGTARLRLSDHAGARAGLESAASRARGAEARFRAEFNAGLTDLEPAFTTRGQDSATMARLRRAVSRYRAALRVRPEDADAKWNLELAERLLARRPEQGGGGGGGAQDQPQPRPGAQQRPPTQSSAGPGNPELSREQADAILAAADREERAVQRRRMREAPPAERAARDW